MDHQRLTLNLGVRFDYLNGYIPEQHAPPARFLPVARDFARIDNVPNQKDTSRAWAPRMTSPGQAGRPSR